MKEFLTLLLVVFIYTVCAQDFDPYDCYGLKTKEHRYQVLLKKWYDGANGHGQGGAVDSIVLDGIKNSIYYSGSLRNIARNTPKMLKILEDLQHYRGLGIFNTEENFTTVIAKVLKEYYNVDIKDLKKLDMGNTGVEYIYGTPKYMLLSAWELPNEEQIFCLYSNITGEVVSTYKEKIKKRSPLEQKECDGKDFILMEYIGIDSVKITEF